MFAPKEHYCYRTIWLSGIHLGTRGCQVHYLLEFGHIHKAEVRDIDGILYCNDGDWVESLTALVETFEGEMRLVHWRNRIARPLNLGRVDEPQALAV